MINKIKLQVLGLAALLVGLCRGGTIYGLANEAAATTRSAQHWKRKTAIAIGKPDMADGDDEALEAEHDNHMRVANEAANMPDGPASVTEAANENLTEEQKLALANEQAAERVTAMANEEVVRLRTENAGFLIGAALAAGRILPAAKTEWEGKFANDYDGTRTALANETQKIKTTAVTEKLGDLNPPALANERERRDKVHSLVNETMERDGIDRDAAFDKVKADPKHKALFDAMKKPGKQA